MRFILVLLIWVVFIGGLYGYTTARDEARQTTLQKSPEARAVEDSFSLSIIPTFSVEKDPFALVEDDDSSEGFELWLNGAQVDVGGASLRQGEELIIEKLNGMVVGGNEIFLKASPPVGGTVEHYAVRLQLYKNGAPLKDDTLWSSSGASISGTVSVKLEAEKGDEHDH